MTPTDHIARLHATLRLRETPETVAKLVRDALPTGQAKTVFPFLAEVIERSVKRFFGWSSMATAFRAPDKADKPIAKARELARLFLDGDLPDGEDPDALDAVIDAFDRLIGKTRGLSSFKDDRLDRAGRVALNVSRRRYGKLFRLAGRLERKAARLREEQAKLELVLVSKAALAPRLTIDDLGGDVPTAAFVAYYAARMKLRSEFTIDGQQRPFDALSATLLALCEKNPGTRWWAIAHVFPRADVLQRLSDEERGRLLGTWFDILQVLADRLDAVRARSAIDVETMVVKRGNDSSTWNMLAGAWNRARDHWIALVEAMEMDGLFDTMLPGKVMRLMAGDVAAWHRSSGGGTHPDTLVWRALPAPWLVLRGEAACTRADIENACEVNGVDPVKSGWAAARPRTTVAQFRPTPELVHGVAVSNPYLAAYFRRVGVFSGKVLKADIEPD
jgi:hypothetical protein